MPASDCPRCRAPLVKALLDDAYVVEHCERCRGILLLRRAFAEAVHPPARKCVRRTGTAGADGSA